MTGTTTDNKNGSDKSMSDDDSLSLSLGFSDDDDDDSSSTDQRKRTATAKVEQRPKKFFKTTTPRKPSRKKNTIQKKMMVLEQQKQVRLRKLKLRELAMNASDHECDSDEELGLNYSPKEKTGLGSAVKQKESKPIDLLSSSSDSSPDSSPAKPNPPETNNKHPVILELSDDDDSDEDIDYSKIQVRYDEKTAALMRGAGDATASLLASNDYHADDIHVEVQEDQFLQLRAPTIRRTVPRPKPKIHYGKPIQVKCHCGHLVIGGQRVAVEKDKQSITLMVKEKEPLSALAERFCKAHSLPYEQSTVTLNFDGDKLELTKTPLQCEIDEDGYIVDFKASAPMRCT